MNNIRKTILLINKRIGHLKHYQSNAVGPNLSYASLLEELETLKEVLTPFYHFEGLLNPSIHNVGNISNCYSGLTTYLKRKEIHQQLNHWIYQVRVLDDKSSLGILCLLNEVNEELKDCLFDELQ